MTQKLKQLKIYLSKKTEEELKEIAKHFGIKPASLVSKILVSWIKCYQTPDCPRRGANKNASSKRKTYN
jgi:hypothetical protein